MTMTTTNTHTHAHTTSAPGKLVLAGEYAVTDGARALVAAVDVRAVVHTSPAPTLLLEGNVPRAVDASHRAELRARLPLLAAVVEELDARGHTLPNVHARVDTSAFHRAGEKVGLGSSAAACVALVRALASELSPGAVFHIARDAHRAFQGGGSGIDIAASSYGGLVAFENGEASPGPALPAGLAYLAVYVGYSTSTQGFVDRYKALADRAQHADRLARAAGAFEDACRRQDAAALLLAVDAAREAMRTMGEAAGIDVVSVAHERVAELAHHRGGAAKPSGAGGGDVAFVALPGAQRDAFAAACAHAGFTVLPVAIGAEGVRADG